MKSMMAMLSLLLSSGGLANAQTGEEVQLQVGWFNLAANGAEKAAGGWFGTGPLRIGEPSVGVFSSHGCGAHTVATAKHTFEDDATVGWRVEVTPTRVVNHAVTFRLRWVRGLDKTTTGLTPIGEDVEVTLRPGESRPIDSVPVVQVGAKTVDGRPCGLKAVSLRVVADFPDFDRRLIGVDAWLVERLPNGKEQSQAQSLRGLPNRPIAFYFDGVPDGAEALRHLRQAGGRSPAGQDGGCRRGDPGGDRCRRVRLLRRPLVQVHAALETGRDRGSGAALRRQDRPLGQAGLLDQAPGETDSLMRGRRPATPRPRGERQIP